MYTLLESESSSSLFKFRLNRPLVVQRRHLISPDAMFYQGELLKYSYNGFTGYGEVICSRQLAHEMAQLDLQSRLRGMSIPDLLGRPILHENIPVAWMYSNIILPFENRALGAISTIKFKVGSDWAREAEKLIELRKNMNTGISIRLDANQSMSLKDAIQFGKRIATVGIVYFEEPLRDPSEIPAFVQATGIPVALDESLSQNHPIFEGVSTLALKPFMMPNLKTIFHWIDSANEHNLDLVIASCFESSLGISWLVMFAGLASPKLLPAGLSTYSWFDENFFEPSFETFKALEAIRTLHL